MKLAEEGEIGYAIPNETDRTTQGLYLGWHEA